MIKLFKEKPLIKLMKTPKGYYFYDAYKNSIGNIDEETYCYLNKMLRGVENLIYTKKVEEKIESLRLYGYFNDFRVKEIKQQDSYLLKEYINSKIEKVTLQVTQNCNLMCKYCAYAFPEEGKQRKHHNKNMNFSTAKDAIDYFLKHSIDNKIINIGFYGGEPLLNFSLIKKCIEYVNSLSLCKQISFSITSNATLIDENIIKFFIKNKVILLISMDGPENIHDKNRKFYNGSGSYEKVIKVIHRIIEIDPEYAASVRVNSVLDKENEFNCYDNFFTTEEIFKTIKFRTNFLNKNLLDSEFSKNELFDIQYSYEHFKLLLYKLGEMSNENISDIVEKGHITLSRFIDQLKIRNPLSSTMHHSGPCVPGVKRLFVDADGFLFPCERCSEVSNVMCIGNLEQGINIAKVEEIYNIGQLTSEECKNCWNIRHCNICAMKIDDINKFSKGKKLEICEESKINTLINLYNCILLREFGFDFSET